MKSWSAQPVAAHEVAAVAEKAPQSSAAPTTAPRVKFADRSPQNTSRLNTAKVKSWSSQQLTDVAEKAPQGKFAS